MVTFLTSNQTRWVQIPYGSPIAKKGDIEMKKMPKMSPDEVQAWIAKRKKCCAFKDKKKYNRKEKYKKHEEHYD